MNTNIIPSKSTNTSITLSTVTMHDMDGEPRILDTDLAAILGYAKPVKLRDLIKRHEASLVKFAPLPTVGRVINGGEAKERYLNKRQAIFITAKSETADATTLTINLIEKFDAYEKGLISVAPKFQIPQTYAAALLEAGRLAAENAVQKEVIAEMAPKVAAFQAFCEDLNRPIALVAA